jgi:beta-mannan synthase
LSSAPATAANAGLDFQAAVSWLIGVLNGSSTAAADAYGAWVAVRAGLIAPALQAAVWACLVMSVMLVVEAVYNSAVSLGVKAIGWRPEWRFKWESLPGGGGDEEKGSAHYPMVLVQIPMYNELEVRHAARNFFFRAVDDAWKWKRNWIHWPSEDH